MARTRKQDNNVRPFVPPDMETKPLTSLRGIPPQNRANAEVMSDPTKREYAGNLLHALAMSFKMKPVQSNQELAERIEDYIQYCSECQILPTMEGLALYCGYSRSTLFDWKSGRNHGFNDTVSGFTTSALVEKAYTILQAFDADMAMNAKVSPVSYIFRAKANWRYDDRVTVEVTQDNGNMRPPLTPEEIARNLPDVLPEDIIRNLPEGDYGDGGEVI